MTLILIPSSLILRRLRLRQVDPNVLKAYKAPLDSPAAFRAGDDNGSPSERRREPALRTGLEDIRAALENASSPLRGERFVDVLEKIHRSLGEVGDSAVEYMVPTVRHVDPQ